MTTSIPGGSRPCNTPHDHASDSQQSARATPGADRTTSPFGVSLPPDLRAGPVVVGVDNAVTCGRPLRAAVFLARSLGRPLVAVHVRRGAAPHVEGYVRIPEELELDESVEDALEAALSAVLTGTREMADVSWEFVSTSGDAAVELIHVANGRDAACLVVGRHHRGFGRFLHHIASGSVSHAVVSSHKFPVLVVP